VHRHTHTPLFSSTLPTPLAHTLGTSYIRDVSPYVSSGIRSRKENMYKLNQGKISFTLSALHKLALMLQKMILFISFLFILFVFVYFIFLKGKPKYLSKVS
jgi:hypothetical protein